MTFKIGSYSLSVAVVANLYWLNQVQSHHQALVGNKAFYLSQLLHKGFPVVPGFVVSTTAFRQFLESINWAEPLFADLPHSSLRLDIENPRQLQAIAQQIRHAIETSTLSADWLTELDRAIQQLQVPVVVLRPSLLVKTKARTVAASGVSAIVDGSSSALFDIQICQATGIDVADGLKRLWAQLFRAKSLFYWQRLGIQLQQVKLAVLVQPIRSAIASGSTQMLDQTMTVQATNGLGMAIAWGEVLPDVYQVHTVSGRVQTRQLGKRAIAYHIEPSVSLQQPHTAIDNAACTCEREQMDASAVGSHRLTATPTETQPTNQPPLTHCLTAPPLLSAPTLPLLQACLLDDAQQQRYALTDAQLHAAIQLAQRLASDMQGVAAIEWTLWVENEGAEHKGAKDGAEDKEQFQLDITQIMPRLRTAQAQALLQSVNLSLASASVPLPTVLSQPALLSPESNQPTALDKLSSLLVTGLAAAPGRAIARARVITQPNESLDTIPPGTILVAETLPPQWLPLIQQAAGVVTEQGSMTAHSAIIARAVGIPAVMAAPKATQQIQTGDLVLIDGDRGKVYQLADDRSPTDSTIADITIAEQSAVTLPVPHDRPPLGTRLLVTLSQLRELAAIATLPIDGIGLLRGELLTIACLDYQHPAHWLKTGRSAALVARLATAISQFAAALAPRPVFYRSLDLRSHESRGLPGGDGIPLEVNPALGLHGTFSYCLDPTLFDLELAALAQVQVDYPNIHLILPFVRTVEEFQFCRQRVENAGLMRHSQFQLWLMAEVPSVLFLLPEYVKAGVQGIAIGTNDLTQLLLGVDRDHGGMASAFDTRHPAVKAAIAHLIQQAHQAGIPCSICGQLPSHDPAFIEALVHWGITSIAVEPAAVESTYWAIARAEQKLLLEAARQLNI